MKIPKYPKSKDKSNLDEWLKKTENKWISNNSLNKQYERMPRKLKKQAQKLAKDFNHAAGMSLFLSSKSPNMMLYRIFVLLTPKIATMKLKIASRNSKKHIHAGLNEKYINPDGTQMTTEERIISYPKEIHLYKTN